MAVTPSAQYSVTLRVETDSRDTGAFGRLVTAIDATGGDIGAVDLVSTGHGTAVREIVVKAFDRATEVLQARRADLDEGARLLLAQETVTADQFPAIRSTAAKPAPAAQGAQP